MKIGTDHDKMENLIKYNICVKYHKKCLFEKERTFSSNHKTIDCFFL